MVKRRMKKMITMKLYSFEEVLDMQIGKIGTPRRDKFEQKMKVFIKRHKKRDWR